MQNALPLVPDGTGINSLPMTNAYDWEMMMKIPKKGSKSTFQLHQGFFIRTFFKNAGAEKTFFGERLKINKLT